MHHRYFVENEEEGPLYFTIGVNSGIIRTTQVLDREKTAWHNITVMAAEVGKFTATTAQFRLSVLCFFAYPSITMAYVFHSAAHPKAICLPIHPPLCAWEAYTSSCSWLLFPLVPVEAECTYFKFFCSRL